MRVVSREGLRNFHLFYTTLGKSNSGLRLLLVVKDMSAVCKEGGVGYEWWWVCEGGQMIKKPHNDREDIYCII